MRCATSCGSNSTRRRSAARRVRCALALVSQLVAAHEFDVPQSMIERARRAVGRRGARGTGAAASAGELRGGVPHAAAARSAGAGAQSGQRRRCCSNRSPSRSGSTSTRPRSTRTIDRLAGVSAGKGAGACARPLSGPRRACRSPQPSAQDRAPRSARRPCQHYGRRAPIGRCWGSRETARLLLGSIATA